MSSPLVLFVVTEDWYFVSHRLALALRLREAGYSVALATRFTAHREIIEAMGIRCLPIRLRRRAGSLVADLRAIAELRRLYRRERPEIVHHVALKPVVFGGIASLGLRRLVAIHAIAGLGLLFSSRAVAARAGRLVARPLLGAILRRSNSRSIVQTPEDAAFLAALSVAGPGKVTLIPGAGVDLAEFPMVDEPPGPPIVVYAGRMLRDKGVPEFLAAAAALLREGVTARFQLVGEPDPDNPSSMHADELEAWHRSGTVEWVGRRSDMPVVLARSHVVCLPTTYGEGVPKILLEAGACGRAVVATNWPGCRQVVQHGETGLLVPPRDVPALAGALRALIEDPTRRTALGAAARRLVESRFSIDAVARQTLAVYAAALRR